MSFYEPKDLKLGTLYKLKESVEGNEVSTGDYFLVSMDEYPQGRYPALGFCQTKNGKATVFLVEAHAQFGDPTWRRAFKVNNRWEIYCPAGARLWNQSYVIIEDSNTNSI